MGGPETSEGLIERIAIAVCERLGPRIAENDGRLDEVCERMRQLAATLEADRPKAAPACDVTWERLWDIYWDREHGKLESWKSRRSEGRAIVKVQGTKLVVEADGNTVREFQAARYKMTTKRGGPPAPKTVNNEVVLMLHLTKWGARQKPPIIPADPFASIVPDDLLDRVENTRLNVVEDDPAAPLSLATFLSHGDEFDRALCLAAHSSGMRRGELVKLDGGWIDRRIGPDGRPLRLVWIPPGVAKGRRGHKKGRLTILSEEALEAIAVYRRTLPLILQHRAGVVFANADTCKAYHPDSFTARFRRLQQRAGAEGPSGPVWLHDLRRSFITLARRRGEDAVNVMKLAGHTTLESQERYHVPSIREAILLRDRIEQARAADLASLAKERAGPQRATVDNYEIQKSKARW